MNFKQKISGLSDVINKYDYFIFDIWGVIHDGSELYPNVIETLNYIRKYNKKVCFLSNAPRRASKVEVILSNFGIDKTLYDFVLSSGESAFIDLKNNQESNFNNFGRKYFYLGPNKDLDLLEGLSYERTDSLNKADFILNTGFDDNESNIHKKLSLVNKAIKHNLPMLCVNPDLIVVKKSGIEMLCAGVLALEYKNLGGIVHYYGKPFKKVYEMVFNKYLMSDKSKFIALGDGLETDIKGANDFNIDNVLVTGGILAKELGIKYWEDANESLLDTIFSKYDVFPKYVISNLKI